MRGSTVTFFCITNILFEFPVDIVVPYIVIRLHTSPVAQISDDRVGDLFEPPVLSQPQQLDVEVLCGAVTSRFVLIGAQSLRTVYQHRCCTCKSLQKLQIINK